jgi:hypothetical protein
MATVIKLRVFPQALPVPGQLPVARQVFSVLAERLATDGSAGGSNPSPRSGARGRARHPRANNGPVAPAGRGRNGGGGVGDDRGVERLVPLRALPHRRPHSLRLLAHLPPVREPVGADRRPPAWRLRARGESHTHAHRPLFPLELHLFVQNFTLSSCCRMSKLSHISGNSFHSLLSNAAAASTVCRAFWNEHCHSRLVPIVFFFLPEERSLGLMREPLYWQGFPGSVTPDYVPFQVWDTLQVSLSARLDLCSQPCRYSYPLRNYF